MPRVYILFFGHDRIILAKKSPISVVENSMYRLSDLILLFVYQICKTEI